MSQTRKKEAREGAGGGRDSRGMSRTRTKEAIGELGHELAPVDNDA
jgi:hypothetical protein